MSLQAWLAAGVLSIAATTSGAAKPSLVPNARLSVGAATCALPTKGWRVAREGRGMRSDRVVTNRVLIAGRNRLFWNDATIDVPTMRQYVELTSQMAVQPVLVVRADPRASCAFVAEMMASFARTLRCTAALCRFEIGDVDTRRLPLPPPTAR